jgi:hypothetical protein
MDLFIHELPKEKTKERVKVEVLSPAHMWDNSKAKAPGQSGHRVPHPHQSVGAGGLSTLLTN